jgi:hypothetical protein
MPVARREAKRKLRNAQASSNAEKNRAQATRNTRQQQSQNKHPGPQGRKFPLKMALLKSFFVNSFYTASKASKELPKLRDV